MAVRAWPRELFGQGFEAGNDLDRLALEVDECRRNGRLCVVCEGNAPTAAVQRLGVTARVRLGLSLDGPWIVVSPICGTCAGASDVEAKIEAALARRWVESLAAARG